MYVYTEGDREDEDVPPPYDASYCAPCADGEHATMEDGVCLCCNWRATYDLVLCENCIWTDAYGEPLPDAEPDAPGMALLAGWDVSPADEEGIAVHFGRYCDGCATRYAGSRYRYVGLPPREA